MDVAAAKRIYNGIFLAHLLLAAQLVVAGKTIQLCLRAPGVCGLSGIRLAAQLYGLPDLHFTQQA
jgi:hypothetical protein